MQKQKNYKPVAIIILNWNSYKDTFECLKSLETLNYPSFKIFLVDNNSTDDSFQKLKEDFLSQTFQLDICFIQSNENLGFAGGNNLGIQQANKEGYELFWLLNNDTYVDSNALINLVKTMEEEPKVGIVGSKIYYSNTNKIWFAGGKISRFLMTPKHIGFGEEDLGQYDKQQEVDYITGCSLLFNKKLIDDIGYMCEDYFLYYEETDWNIRARQKGWRILYNPESIVYHKVSMSSGGEKNPAIYIAYYDIRNNFVMVIRNKKFIYRFFAFINMFVKLFKGIIKIYIKGYDKKLLRIVYMFKGIKDAITLKMGRVS